VFDFNFMIHTHRLTDILSGLLFSDVPGIVDVGACFNCHENVFTGRFLAMDNFSGSTMPVFSCHVTILFLQQ
jgi:hypothetical protein